MTIIDFLKSKNGTVLAHNNRVMYWCEEIKEWRVATRRNSGVNPRIFSTNDEELAINNLLGKKNPPSTPNTKGEQQP